MIDFTKLSRIKQEKYGRKLAADELDGRSSEDKINLVSSKGEPIQLTQGELRLKFKDVWFIADIMIELTDGDTEQISIDTKIKQDKGYTSHTDELCTDEGMAHAVICSLCDEIKISFREDVEVDSIKIYYLYQEDIAEIFDDVAFIDEVIKELEGEEERHTALVDKNTKLESLIENQKLNYDELISKNTSLQVEQKQLDSMVKSLEEKVETKNSIIKQKNKELSNITESLQEKNRTIQELNKEIGNYPDTLKGFRQQSRHTQFAYFLLACIPLFLTGIIAGVIINQAIDYSYQSFKNVNEALSFLIAKLPITAALVTAVLILIRFTRYCVEIIKDVGDRSLELTRISVLTRQIIDHSSQQMKQDVGLTELNYQKSRVIGQLLADLQGLKHFTSPMNRNVNKE